MSSDTYLSLREYKDPTGRFYELECCTSAGEVIEPVGIFRELRQALVMAENYQRDNDVEYGLSFFPMTD